MTGYLPAFTPEWPDHPETDCVPSSALMVVNKVTHNAHPAGAAEREALQNAMLTQDQGATNEQAAAGVKARYGLSIPLAHGWPAIAAALADPSRGLAIIGSYQKLPPLVRNHGLQPSFDGLHDLYAQQDGLGLVAIGDPLGSTFQRGVPLDALRAYAESTVYAALLGTEQPAIIGYRVNVRGRFTAWKVARWTHIPYSPLTGSFALTGSSAPAFHGAPGFWLISAGPLAGRYAIYGRSPAFTVTVLWSDGQRTTASPSS